MHNKKHHKRSPALPVDEALPDGVVHAVEEVQEHGSNVAGSRPVCRGKLAGLDGGRVDVLAGVPNLPGIATAPDSHGQHKDDHDGNAGASGTADTFTIQQGTNQDCCHDLRKPVQEVVEGLGASVEVSAVDTVHLVGVEPVGRPEHGEEQDNPRFGANGLPQAEDLSLPARVLHQDHARAVRADNLVGVAEEEGEDCAESHEHNESNVSAVVDGLVLGHMDILAEGDLHAG